LAEPFGETFFVISNFYIKNFAGIGRGFLVIDWAGLFGYDWLVRKRAGRFYGDAKKIFCQVEE
jgi:hypothetical protein